MPITTRLAEYIHKTSYEDIPKETHRYVKLCLLDWIGVTLGGSREPVSDILLDFTGVMGGEKHASIIGKGIKTNVLLASLVNGTMSHALDFDDSHEESGIHPTVCLAPAVISVGEYKKSSGRDLITAFIVGFEVTARIGGALWLDQYRRGWHTTSTIGRFGAAIGAAKLMNLSLEQIVNAFGIAGSQMSGLREVFGTMNKPFHAGKAAMDGVLSAVLAKKNFDSSHRIFEGRYGLKNVYAPEADLTHMTAGLGAEYQIMDVAFKPYASALATHSTIQAIETIKREGNIAAGEVQSIQIEFGGLPFSVVNNKNPHKELEGKFSVYQCAALAFLKERVTVDMFTLKEIHDPEIVAFRKKINVLQNPKLKKFETIIKVVTNQGKVFEHFIKMPKGSPEDPLTFIEMKTKFMDLARPVIPKENAEKIVEKIRFLPEIEDINEITALCHP